MFIYIYECYCVPLSSSRSSIIDPLVRQSNTISIASQSYRIQRSCEDYCCRRSNLIRKSINSATNDYRRADRCELSKVIIPLMRTEMWSFRYYISQLSHCFDVTAYCLWNFFCFLFYSKTDRDVIVRWRWIIETCAVYRADLLVKVEDAHLSWFVDSSTDCYDNTGMRFDVSK